MELRKSLKRLSTKTPIDNLIGGGIQQTEVVEFYGGFGCGKTQICQTLTVEVAVAEGDVIYVDTEDTFKPERIIQIAENKGYDVEQVLESIHLVPVLTCAELEAVFESIPNDLDPTLVVVDSITALYREEYVGRGTLSERQGALRKFIVALKRYVRRKKCYCVVTNQVHDDPGAGPFLPLYLRQKAVGGHTLYHIIDSRIFLGQRIARLMDSSRYPEGEAPFIINEYGIEDPEAPRIRAEQQEEED